MSKEKPKKIKKSFDLNERIANALKEEALKKGVHEVDIIHEALFNYLDLVKYEEVVNTLDQLRNSQLRSIRNMIEEIIIERKRRKS